jgi:hypothetical protein
LLLNRVLKLGLLKILIEVLTGLLKCEPAIRTASLARRPHDPEAPKSQSVKSLLVAQRDVGSGTGRRTLCRAIHPLRQERVPTLGPDEPTRR